MIGALLRLPVFALVAAIVAWAAWLALGAGQPSGAGPDSTAMVRAYSDPDVIKMRLDWALRQASSLEAKLPALPAGISGRLGEGILLAAVHARILLDAFPIVIHAALIGILAGAYARERLRRGNGSYASPTAAFIGRSLVVAAGLVLLVFGLTPFLGWAGVPYGSAAAVASGSALYVANLPLRL